MSEKYNTNINSIEEAIKQLEDLKKDRLSFVTGDKEHDEIYLKDIQAIKIVLGNLEALCDMQKTADRELENARRINEEHKRENGELIEKVKELEEYIFIAPNLDEMTATKYTNIQREAYFRGRAEEQQKAEQIIYENYIPKQKIKEIEDVVILTKANIITNEIEYTPNANANSYLTQQILELLQESEEK